MYEEFELKRWRWQKQTIVKTQECTLTTKLEDYVIFETIMGELTMFWYGENSSILECTVNVFCVLCKWPTCCQFVYTRIVHYINK